MTIDSWYADGLRWLGTLLHDAADRFERVSLAAVPLEPRLDLTSPEEHVSELRHRIHSHYY
jgi:hypothetical protein